MYLVHVVLSGPGGTRPTQADAETLVDRIWARADPRLGIQHLHARAAGGHIDLAVFLTGPPPAGLAGGVGTASAAETSGTAIPRILELISEWSIAEARRDWEENP